MAVVLKNRRAVKFAVREDWKWQRTIRDLRRKSVVARRGYDSVRSVEVASPAYCLRFVDGAIAALFDERSTSESFRRNVAIRVHCRIRVDQISCYCEALVELLLRVGSGSKCESECLAQLLELIAVRSLCFGLSHPGGDEFAFGFDSRDVLRTVHWQSRRRIARNVGKLFGLTGHFEGLWNAMHVRSSWKNPVRSESLRTRVRCSRRRKIRGAPDKVRHVGVKRQSGSGWVKDDSCVMLNPERLLAFDLLYRQEQRGAAMSGHNDGAHG